jgi:hypothetical protein
MLGISSEEKEEEKDEQSGGGRTSIFEHDLNDATTQGP